MRSLFTRQKERSKEGDLPYGSRFRTPKKMEDLLLLFLGLKEKQVLPKAWEYLTIQELVAVRMLNRSIRQQLEWIDYTHCRDGRDYRVPFPGFPGLFGTPADVAAGAGLFPHQLASLRAMYQAEYPLAATKTAMTTATKTTTSDPTPNSPIPFGALRGGILADAPGLGKSITMLAMIASTAGTRPASPPEFWDTSAIEKEWQWYRINEASAPMILAAMKPIRQWVEEHIPKQDPLYGRYQWLCEYINPPYPDARFPTLKELERTVIGNVKSFVPKGPLELFKCQLAEMKAGMDKSSRKLFASRQGQRVLYERKLIPSSGTLLVVPDALLEHWFQQISLHLQLSRFVDGDFRSFLPCHEGTEAINNYSSSSVLTTSTQRAVGGVVYLDGIGDFIHARTPLRAASSSRDEVPHAWELSQYLIVITTFSRCQTEFRNQVAAGRLAPVEEPKQRRKHFKKKKAGKTNSSRNGKSAQFSADHNGEDEQPYKKRPRRQHPDRLAGIIETGSPSPLLQVRWLRLVVDEGHELGTHEAGSEATRFIHEIAAERRWVLSGTPTTGDEDSNKFTANALDQLQRLLLFLRHPIYGNLPSDMVAHSVGGTAYQDGQEDRKRKQQAKELWATNVKQPFLAQQTKGREELLVVLKELMVMHRKEDIKLPKPVFQNSETLVPVPPKKQRELRELLLNPRLVAQELDKYLHTAEYQSLVDRAQAEYIVKAIQKAKDNLSKRGGALWYNPSWEKMAAANVVADFKYMNHSHDRRPIKAVVYSHNKNNLLSVTEQLYRLTSPENIAELYDTADIGDMGAELSRFRHGFKEIRTCPICNRPNDLDIKLRFFDRCQNTLLEVVVLSNDEDVGNDDASENSLFSSDDSYDSGRRRCGQRFLIEPERICRALSQGEGGNVNVAKLGGEPLSSYGKHQRFWSVGDVLEVDIRDPHPLLARRIDEQQWELYGSKKCKKLAQSDDYFGYDWYFGPFPPVESGKERIIVKLAKWQRCGQFHNPTRWYQGPRLGDSQIERVQEDVFILSLDAGLSHGLDLSFVTHMFLLETISDAALLEQVTSRAHRLGATGPVTVDTVFCWFKVASDIQAAIDTAENDSSLTRKCMQEEKRRILKAVVCEHCFREFGSASQADAHAKTNCARNPENMVGLDPFHVSSVYHELKPPPALATSEE